MEDQKNKKQLMGGAKFEKMTQSLEKLEQEWRHFKDSRYTSPDRHHLRNSLMPPKLPSSAGQSSSAVDGLKFNRLKKTSSAVSRSQEKVYSPIKDEGHVTPPPHNQQTNAVSTVQSNRYASPTSKQNPQSVAIKKIHINLNHLKRNHQQRKSLIANNSNACLDTPNRVIKIVLTSSRKKEQVSPFQLFEPAKQSQNKKTDVAGYDSANIAKWSRSSRRPSAQRQKTNSMLRQSFQLKQKKFGAVCTFPQENNHKQSAIAKEKKCSGEIIKQKSMGVIKHSGRSSAGLVERSKNNSGNKMNNLTRSMMAQQPSESSRQSGYSSKKQLQYKASSQIPPKPPAATKQYNEIQDIIRRSYLCVRNI